MLMFLYSLDAVVPKVRSFAFSSDLTEAIEQFERDYGQAFADFRKLCMDDVDNRTIVILGDARNNYGDPRTDILKEMYDRAKRVIWLNPESRHTWTTGDAEMRKYTAYVHQAEECNSLLLEPSGRQPATRRGLTDALARLHALNLRPGRAAA